MKSRWKWLIGGMGATLCAVLVLAYGFARPFIVQKLEPLLETAATEWVNGSLTWQSVRINAYYDLEFQTLELRNAEGQAVLTAPRLTVGWSAFGLYEYLTGRGGVLSVVKDITVTNPHLDVRRHGETEWNVQTLLHETKERTSETFEGRIHVEKGVLSVSPSNRETYVFDDFDGLFAWDQNGVIKGRVKGSFMGNVFSADLQYTDEENFEGRITADEVGIPSVWKAYQLYTGEIEGPFFESGILYLEKGVFQKQKGALTYDISGEAKDVSFQWGAYSVENGNGLFEISNTQLRCDDVKATLNDGQLTGYMKVDLSGQEKTLSGEAKFEGVQIKGMIPDTDVKGMLSGRIAMGGTWDSPVVTGQASIENGQYGSTAIQNGEADFSYELSVLTLPFFRVETGSGMLSGSGLYDRKDGTFVGDVQIEEADLGTWSFGLPLSGRMSAILHGEGRYQDGYVNMDRLSFTGEGTDVSYETYSAGRIAASGTYGEENQWNVVAEGSDITVQGVSFDTAAGYAWGSGDSVYISSLTGTMGEGTLQMEGSLVGGELDMRIGASDIDASRFCSVTNTDAEGRVSFSANVTGTTEHPQVRAHVDARDGQVRQARFNQISGDLYWHDDVIDIEDLLWLSAEGRHTVSGQWGLTEPHPMSLTVRTEDARAESLLRLTGLSYPLTGWVDNILTVSGTLVNPVIQGDVHIWNGSFKEELFDSVSAEYTYANGVASIRNGLGYLYNGTVLVNGTVASDAMDLDTSFFDADIGQILPDQEWQGKVTFRGHVTGSFGAPALDGVAFSRSVKMKDVSVEAASAAVHYENGTVILKDGSFRQGEGNFTWHGLYHADTRRVEGDLGFQGWNMRTLADYFGLPSDVVEGTVSGRMTLRGTVDSPDVTFTAQTDSGRLGDVPMGAGDVDISYTGGKLNIRKCHIPVGDGILAAQGFMEKDGSLDMQAAATGVDISWMPKILGRPEIALAGRVTALIDVSGTKENPKAEVSVGIENPQYGSLSFDSFTLMGNVTDKVIDISQCLLIKGAYKAGLKGVMPVNMVTREETGQAVPLDMTLNLDNADLNALALFFDGVTSAKGPVQGQIQLVGDWRDPALMGNVSVNNGEMTLATMKEPLSDVNMHIDFRDKMAKVEGSAKLGGGILSLSGNAAYDEGHILSYEGKASLHATKIKSVYYEGAMDVNLELSDMRGIPGLRGVIDIHDAKMDIPFQLFSSEEQSNIPLMADVEIRLGDKVRLYNAALYDLWLKGNAEIKGPLSAPMMTGRIHAEKGVIKVNATEFKVDDGTAVWGGIPESYLPIIHVLASTEVGHYKIGAELEGPPGEMTTTLKSEPHLDDTQILMLLTLHQDPNSAKGDQLQGALFNAGLTMLFGGGVQEFLSDKIGLDLISVTSSLTDYYDSTETTGDNYYYIKIGKYIFNDFMLTATTGVNNEKNSIGFHYDVNSHLGISSWYNNEHDSYWGMDWKIKF